MSYIGYQGNWKHKHGMRWIYMGTRLAIYHRDRFDCTWCRCVFPIDITGRGLSLDHLHDPRVHSPCNLVTACPDCNSQRGSQTVDQWLRGKPTARARMEANLKRPLDRALGKALMLHRKGGPVPPEMLLGVP